MSNVIAVRSNGAQVTSTQCHKLLIILLWIIHGYIWLFCMVDQFTIILIVSTILCDGWDINMDICVRHIIALVYKDFPTV